MHIEFRDVSKSYWQKSNGRPTRIEVVPPTSFEIDSGEFFTLIGPSGCGKSTLLNMLAGLEKPDTGTITVGGKPVTQPGPDRAVVFQEAGLMPWLTVLGNVEYGLKRAGIPKPERTERALQYLKMVHLSRFAQALPHQLSGGMKQRVSIARGLALEPQVLLMDEPFSALDAQTRDLLHEELQAIWERTGRTMFFVTHNLAEAAFLSDRIALMGTMPGGIRHLARVPLAHPRSKASRELNDYTAQLHGQLREIVAAAQAREMDPDWQPVAPGAETRGVIQEGEGI